MRPVPLIFDISSLLHPLPARRVVLIGRNAATQSSYICSKVRGGVSKSSWQQSPGKSYTEQHAIGYWLDAAADGTDPVHHNNAEEWWQLITVRFNRGSGWEKRHRQLPSFIFKVLFHDSVLFSVNLGFWTQFKSVSFSSVTHMTVWSLFALSLMCYIAYVSHSGLLNNECAHISVDTDGNNTRWFSGIGSECNSASYCSGTGDCSAERRCSALITAFIRPCDEQPLHIRYRHQAVACASG